MAPSSKRSESGKATDSHEATETGRKLMHGAVSDVTQAIGKTPIVRLGKVAAHVRSSIYVKCEYLNPGGSMKDRIALNIIRDAER